MSIPALQPNGELPPGEHQTSLDEVEAMYGSSTGRRKLLMQGLRKAVSNFELSGVKHYGLTVALSPIKKSLLMVVGNTHLLSMWKSWILVFLGSRGEMKNKYGLEFFYRKYY